MSEDTWKPANHLTVNMGLRYDLQWFRPSPYGADSLYVPSLKEVRGPLAGRIPSSPFRNFINGTTIPIALSSAVGPAEQTSFSYLGQDKKNFAPRLGIDYENLPEHGHPRGFGIYFNLIPSNYVGHGRRLRLCRL